MKKTFRLIGMALIAVLMSAGFAACSDDDDDIGDVSNIYGTWQTTHAEGWEKVNGEIYDEWNYDTSESSDSFVRYVFNEDGEVSIYYWSGSRWNLGETFDYSISGNKLRFFEDEYYEDAAIITIKTLTESVLVLEASFSETEDRGKYEEYQKVTFKKVD